MDKRFKLRRDRLRIAAWTMIGPLFCVLVALGYNSVTFAPYGSDIRFQAALSAIVVPLGLAIPFFFCFSIKLGELAAANRKFALMASTDGLTHCLNRNAFTALVEARLESIVPEGDQIHGALLVVDVDNFKQINDRFGHHNGDAFGAETAAERLRRSVEKIAFFANGQHHKLTVSVGGVVFDRRRQF